MPWLKYWGAESGRQFASSLVTVNTLKHTFEARNDDRQNESVVINSCDVMLKYASSHFSNVVSELLLII